MYVGMRTMDPGLGSLTFYPSTDPDPMWTESLINDLLKGKFIKNANYMNIQNCKFEKESQFLRHPNPRIVNFRYKKNVFTNFKVLDACHFIYLILFKFSYTFSFVHCIEVKFENSYFCNQ